MLAQTGSRCERKFDIKRYPSSGSLRVWADMPNNRTAFSLLELMAVIAVIAILAAIAIPNAVAWRNNAQFSAAIRQVKSAIEGTRMAAIKSNLPAGLFFNGTGIFTTQTRGIVGGAAVLNPFVNHRLPAGVTVNANNGGQLTFNSRGLATPCTVTVQHTNGLTNRIIVAITGSSRIQ